MSVFRNVLVININAMKLTQIVDISNVFGIILIRASKKVCDFSMFYKIVNLAPITYCILHK